MSVKNYFIKGLVRLIKAMTFFDSDKSHRFLIVSTTGLGDTLWGTPAIRALREKYPLSYIGVLTSPIGKEIFEHNPHVNEIFLFKKSSFFSLIKLYVSLRKKKISTALIFHTSQRIVIPLCSLVARTLIGTKGINKGLDSLLTDGIEKKSIHEIERRLEIVEKIGVACRTPFLELYVSEEDKRKTDAFFQIAKIPSHIPIIGLHPGAKDRFKQWPPESFMELGLQLRENLGCQIIVTGNAHERCLVENVAEKIPGAIGVHGELSIRSLANLIKRFTVMISNDTGPMHIAYAMQTPTVALFTPTDSKLCGPYYALHAKIIQKPPTCTPCIRKSCMEPFCLRQIGVQEVYDETLKILSKENPYECF